MVLVLSSQRLSVCLSATLVVLFTFLRNLLSHCSSPVCPLGILTELVLSNNVSPLVTNVVVAYLISLYILVCWQCSSLL